MDLPRRMMVAEEAAGQDWDEVFLVVDMRDRRNGSVRIDVVCECLIPDAGKPVSDEGDLEARDVGGGEGGDLGHDAGTNGFERSAKNGGNGGEDDERNGEHLLDERKERSSQTRENERRK